MRGASVGPFSEAPVDGAIPVSRAVRVTGPAPPSAIPPAAVPVVPVRQRSFSPILPALCCLGLILFLIAATIVLSLIPIYTPEKNVDAVPLEEQVNVDIPVDDNANIPNGNLNPSQRSALQAALQNSLNGNVPNNDATVAVNSATAINTAANGRKRQVSSRIVRCVLTLVSRRRSRLRRILILIFSFRINAALANQITSLTTVATTTARPVTTTTNATSNRTRRLVRRSLDEGGAPAGEVYIDANEVAGVKGTVSLVSFYVDETCALATVEFGAFELFSRNLDNNNAELLLKERSGPLKLGRKTELKPYMNLITIRLCSEEMLKAADSNCQGRQFSVLPHQYIGVRSDICRLGFAPVHVDPRYRTTWKAVEDSDPFAEPLTKVNYVPADYTVLHSVTIDAVGSNQKQEIKDNTAAPKVLFIGSYPPRRCGLATFLEDLTNSYPGPYGVVAVDEHSSHVASRQYSDKVVYRLNQTDRDAYYAVADLFNKEDYDILNVQHEYGLYGGMASEYILALLTAVNKPVVTTMHTVPSNPSTIFKSVTRALCAISTRVIVLSEVGRNLLIDNYDIDESKIVVVPHGVPDVPYSLSLAAAKTKLGIDKNVPTISTFGLLHRNKNIQLALEALKTTVVAVPNVLYLVIGQIHPSIQSNEGESYRMELESNVTAFGLTRNVEFVDKFVTDSELLDYLAASDIYLTPYAQEDQYVSGTLSWAVGLGKAVVSTPYLYAKELLADGRGFLVPFADHEALGATLTKILQDETLRNKARELAYRYGRRMTWTSVANNLKQLFTKILVAA